MTGAQSQQNTLTESDIDKTKVVRVCFRKYNLTTLKAVKWLLLCVVVMYYNWNKLLAEMMKSHSMSLTMLFSLTFLFHLPPVDSPKAIASTRNENDSHTRQTTDLSKVTCRSAGTVYHVLQEKQTGKRLNSVRRVTNVSAWTHVNLTLHVLPIPTNSLSGMQTILCRPCDS